MHLLYLYLLVLHILLADDGVTLLDLHVLSIMHLFKPFVVVNICNLFYGFHLYNI